jgi:hypothetical protein
MQTIFMQRGHGVPTLPATVYAADAIRHNSAGVTNSVVQACARKASMAA